jgi:hypothetical protein
MPQRLTSVLRQVATLLLLCVGVAALAGVVWQWVWTPPVGVAFRGDWTLDATALTGDFSGTGWYVVIGSFAGLLVGVAAGLLFDHDELVTLVTVVVGAVLGAWVMKEVGVALGPPDPLAIAKAAEDYTRIPGSLEVVGRSPWAAFPAGALAGLAVTLLGVGHRRPG